MLARFNTILEKYIGNHLSPTGDERALVSHRYEQLKGLLVGESFQVGSYARFTSTTPVHDLDVIWVLSDMQVRKALHGSELDTTDILNDLATRLQSEYSRLGHSYSVTAQTHSVTIHFGEGDDDFTIDVVPAMTSADRNEFGQSIYSVPELIKDSRRTREQKYAEHSNIEWIRTDPLGYIEIASRLNGLNDSFRKTVKFAKAWRHACKRINPNFALKSFHLEQIITRIFAENSECNSVEALEKFFTSVRTHLDFPKIRDRADTTKYIDSYIAEVSDAEKDFIEEKAELALQILCRITTEMNEAMIISFIEDAISDAQLGRLSTGQKFLSGQGIRTSIDLSVHLEIMGEVLSKPGFRGSILNKQNKNVGKDRKIQFKISECSLAAGEYTTKWKVKNRGAQSDNANSLRGEITSNKTLRNPEETRYAGHHFVECYLIKNDVCVAKARQEVIID